MSYVFSCEPHFFRYELRAVSWNMASRYDNTAENAEFAFARYDFLVWC